MGGLYPGFVPEEGLPGWYSSLFYAQKRASLRALGLFYAKRWVVGGRVDLYIPLG